MGKGGFLKAEEVQVLGGPARDGLAEHRLARPAKALILRPRGMSYRHVRDEVRTRNPSPVRTIR